VVAHAGEAAGPESIRDAVTELGAERIGHGVRIIDSPEILADMRDRGIAFEVCPQSNYALGVVEADAPHPIRKMVDGGLRCTVNSDDPGMFATDLVAQYGVLADQGFSWDELWKLNVATLEATFLPADEKQAAREHWAAFAASLATA
jgi:adenosine deaminase